MELELISFNRCPYVQRSVITLLHKKADFKVTYVDLSNKPDWFLEISPFGKVPCLRVTDNGEESVIFESAVINEFVDEVTPGSLLPEDPIQRAVCRSWIEYGGACMKDAGRMVITKDREVFEQARESLQERLGRLEATIGAGPFFIGESFSLVDAAYAPTFMRLEMWRDVFEPYPRRDYPKVVAWSDALLEMPEVKNSVVPELAELTYQRIRELGSYVSTLLTQAA